ncbi:MAG: hypothetical protein ACXV4C_08110 [Halobacteriota archaeon]
MVISVVGAALPDYAVLLRVLLEHLHNALQQSGLGGLLHLLGGFGGGGFGGTTITEAEGTKGSEVSSR